MKPLDTTRHPTLGSAAEGSGLENTSSIPHPKHDSLDIHSRSPTNTCMRSHPIVGVGLLGPSNGWRRVLRYRGAPLFFFRRFFSIWELKTSPNKKKSIWRRNKIATTGTKKYHGLGYKTRINLKKKKNDVFFPGDFGLRSPVIQKPFLDEKCYLHRSMRLDLPRAWNYRLPL